MKNCICVLGLAALVAPFAAYSDSLIRVKCDDDAGASVYINGKFVGECPVDAPAPAGTVNLRVRSENGDYEKIFEKQLRVIDGVPQRVEVTLSAPQLTAKAKFRMQAAEANNLLQEAEAGKVEAMRKVAELYDAGIGVDRSPSKAKIWREKAEAASVEAELRAANSGDFGAMEDIAARYETGRGLKKDTSQAKKWRDKAGAAKREYQAKNAARIKKEKLNQISFFDNTKAMFNKERGFADMNASSFYISIPISLPYALLFDLTSAPTRSYEIIDTRNEAALRPSNWGKPDSMIARASQQLKANDPAAENPLIVAAIK